MHSVFRYAYNRSMFTRALLKTSQAAILLVAGIFIGAAISSFAGWEAGTGVCKHKALTEGVWWQQQFEFRGTTNPLCWELQWNSSDKRGLSVGFAHLGYLSGSNIATLNDTTEDAKHFSGGACESDSRKNCLARFNVRGTEYGVTLGGFTPVGPLTVEGGLFLYRSDFRVELQRMHYVGDLPEGESYHITGYHATPFLGIVFKAKEFYARVRYYQDITQDAQAYPFKGLTGGPVIATTIGFQF